ncbi:MAG: isopentenyl-diphosphate Delta-isomerase [Atopobiaceae bacterium]|nr:isopentenyl-diphosphate Delta-isomerase [Atopobiaceae bacterium]
MSNRDNSDTTTFDDALGDELILVDVLDREIGTLDKLACHQQGLLHRAFSVFLYQGDKILIQRRAHGKYHSGGLWANACCSHPRAGETLEQAVPRRLLDELGATARDIREVGFYVYRHDFDNGLVEHEYDHVFVGELEGEASANPDEIDELRWIGFDELVDELREKPEQFAAWFEGVCAIALPVLVDLLT